MEEPAQKLHHQNGPPVVQYFFNSLFIAIYNFGLTMERGKIFKTKTGYCHILPDKIILTREGVIGNMAKVVSGKNISRLLIIYGLLSALFIFVSFKGFSEDDPLIAGIFLTLGIFLLIGVVKSTNNSATPVIERETIKEIEFKPALPGATRAYFTVYFEDQNLNTKKRLIMLPGSISGGKDATLQALEIMQSEFPNLKNIKW